MGRKERIQGREEPILKKNVGKGGGWFLDGDESATPQEGKTPKDAIARFDAARQWTQSS